MIAAIILTLFSLSGRAARFIVPDDYPTISSAIAEMPAGDTIMIRPGVYYENLVINDKHLCIMSFYQEMNDTNLIRQTVIDGMFRSHTINFNGTGPHNTLNQSIVKGLTVANGRSGSGGGLRIGFSNVLLEDLIIAGNQTLFLSSAPGGGLYVTQSLVEVRNCDFIGNTAWDYGGGASIRGYSTAVFENVRFIGNQVINGLGHGKGAGLHCDYEAKVDLFRCIFSRNQSARWGGAVAINSGAKLNLVNCSAYNNSAVMGGGGIYLCYYDARAIIGNSVFYNNSPQEIFFDGCSNCTNDTVVVLCSDIQGGESGVVLNYSMELQWVEANIDEDPLFNDPETLDFSLTEESPCIDAGTVLYTRNQHDTVFYIPPEGYLGLAPDMGAVESDFLVSIPGPGTPPIRLQIIPNPTGGRFRILIDGQEPVTMQVQIFDSSGRLVAEGTDTEGLPPGVYALRVETGQALYKARLVVTD
jgi:hypothetical protein